LPEERAGPHVALVGFMAAGKSTIGRFVANELGVPFVDTDELIVARHGPIPALFERSGEAGFREAELQAVLEALERPRCVIALGGGAVTHPPTRAALAERAVRVYLDVPAETILARLRRSPTVRPVVGREPTLERVRELMALREPLYRESELVVRGPRRSKLAYARAIVERLRGT
jgi:shikimate kinase